MNLVLLCKGTVNIPQIQQRKNNMKKLIILAGLVLSALSTYGQTVVCGPNHFDANGNPCASFTTAVGGLVTNGPFSHFVVASEDGTPLTQDQFGGIDLSVQASITLPNDPLVELGFAVISDGHLESAGTVTGITTTGTAAKYPAKTAPPLVRTYTYKLGAEETFYCTDDGTCLVFNWQGTFTVPLTFTGKYVCGGGRVCVTHVPVYQIGAGTGEVSAIAGLSN